MQIRLAKKASQMNLILLEEDLCRKIENLIMKQK